MTPETMFRLKKPCGNCPFLKECDLELAPGRLEGIMHDLVVDDMSTFQCHKTVHHERTGGKWDDNGDYHPSGQEAMCAGAAIYLEKLGRPNVAMRLAQVMGVYDPKQFETSFDKVRDPVEGELEQHFRDAFRERKPVEG